MSVCYLLQILISGALPLLLLRVSLAVGNSTWSSGDPEYVTVLSWPVLLSTTWPTCLQTSAQCNSTDHGKI
ncbi:hypothetical protein BDV36DRAFT_130107 [Aspergillus pseudocaelatus]|uniref:Uncharacterized protein n=1 Tax=Aspergillus pseudocaelatus TaxID=1825620 RepID=A0ABQ6WR68_9EURO|nr:hypothetical protein BDV36DRAFT_130107 [Aspergillus pseudocaelatus]